MIVSKPGRQPNVSDRRILREMMMDRAPFVHPTELAETLGMSRQGVYNRLTELEENGLVGSKKTGGTRNFWVTDAGREYATAED
jgi:predicted transcriptional regulator